MLTPEDRLLIDNDVALPGLAALLDGDTLAAALNHERPRWGVRHVEVTYLRYKPGTNCLVACRIHTENGVELAYAKALHHLDNVHRVDSDHLIALPDLKIKLHRFPHDARLPALQKLCTPAERADLLRRLVPNQPELWQGTITPLHYKPERRLVARVDADDAVADNAVAALKFYTADGFEQASAAARRFSALEELRIPQRLGRSRRHSALSLSWIQGDSLSRRLPSPAGQDVPMQAVGAALARIHAHKPGDLAPITAQHHIAAVSAAAEAVAVTAPWLGEMVTDLAYTVAARIREDDARHHPRGCALHGDFSPDQILITEDGRVAVLDFDNAARGHPAADLGSFIAALIHQSGAQVTPQITGYIDQFLRGYQTGNGAPIQCGQVSTYAAAALIRRSPEPFRYRRAAWGEETGRILTCADEVVRNA
ncbi:MAG: aminoglycoside phosphotransferase family protein [Caldilineaceae bacterium]